MAKLGDPKTAAVLAAFENLPPGAFVKRDVVMALVGMSDEGVDRMEKAGKLPKRIKLGTRVNGWQVGELRAALAALHASRREEV